LVLILLSLSFPVFAQTLKIATIAPEGSSWMVDMRAGAGEIAERTDGRVKFKFYGGGVQGNDSQVQRKMRTGQLHGGAFTSGSMNKFQKDADLFALPLVFNSIEEVMYVRKQLDNVLRQRMEDAGFVTFGYAGAGFGYLMSNRPLAILDDLRGQKVWTPEGDPIGYAALRALGIAPVTMPLTDVMTGLQTDLIDSVTVPPVGAVVLQWHTRLKYITEVPVAYVYAALIIDKKPFSRISETDQLIVREVMEKIYSQFDENGRKDNESAMQALLESGLKIVATEEAEVNSWRKIVLKSHREVAENGVYDVELLNQVEAHLKELRAR